MPGGRFIFLTSPPTSFSSEGKRPKGSEPRLPLKFPCSVWRPRVQGSGFRVQGSGFRVQGSGFRVQGFGFIAAFDGLVEDKC